VPLHLNKVLCFDLPTLYHLIFDTVIAHNGDEPLKDCDFYCYIAIYSGRKYGVLLFTVNLQLPFRYIFRRIFCYLYRY